MFFIFCGFNKNINSKYLVKLKVFLIIKIISSFTKVLIELLSQIRLSSLLLCGSVNFISNKDYFLNKKQLPCISGITYLVISLVFFCVCNINEY